MSKNVELHSNLADAVANYVTHAAGAEVAGLNLLIGTAAHGKVSGADFEKAGAPKASAAVYASWANIGARAAVIVGAELVGKACGATTLARCDRFPTARKILLAVIAQGEGKAVKPAAAKRYVESAINQIMRPLIEKDAEKARKAALSPEERKLEAAKDKADRKAEAEAEAAAVVKESKLSIASAAAQVLALSQMLHSAKVIGGDPRCKLALRKLADACEEWQKLA